MPARNFSGPVSATIVLCAISLASPRAAEPAEAPEVAQPCLACHGEVLGEGVPPIAGHFNNYIQLQLVAFRSGRRQNEIMQGMAAGLSDNDIRALGKYFSSLPIPAAATQADEQPDLTKAGQRTAAQFRCANCHGDKFLGSQGAPRVAHLPEFYVAKALTDYRANTRPSSGGGAMTEVAGGLSDDNIKTLAHYLAVLP